MSAQPAMSSGGPGDAVGLDRRQILVIMSGLMVTIFLSALDGTIVATAVPTIAGDLGNLSALPWVFTIYLLSQTASSPLLGKLSDMYGRRTLLQIAVVLFLIGSLACGVSQSMIQLVISRAVQGIGAGGIMSLSFAIVADVVPARERGRYIGLFTGVFGISSVAGPLIGGAVVDHWGWRWAFLVNLPIGAAALVATSLSLRMTWTRSSRRVDFEGAALLISAITCFLLAASWGGKEYPWGSSQILGLVIAAAILGSVFVWWEGRAEEPILPLRLFKVRNFAVTTSVSVLIAGSMFAVSSYLPMWFQVVKGTSATESGLRVAPMALSMTFASIAVGRRIALTGNYRRWPIVGTCIVGTGFVLISSTDAGTALWFIAVGQVLIGLGMGSTMPVLSIAAQNTVEPRDMGTATSTLSFSRSLGGSIGVALLGAVLFGHLQSELRSTLPAGSDTSREGLERLVNSPQAIRALPDDVSSAVINAFGRSFAFMFVTALPVLVVAAVTATRLRQDELKRTAGVTAADMEPAVT